MTVTIQSGTRFGAYVVEKPLSKAGGMAQVFLAAHVRSPQLKVALKVQIEGDQNSAAFSDLLDREIEVLQSVRHPGIVRIYPLDIDGRLVYRAKAHSVRNQPWYFAMEYLDGRMLDSCLKEVSQMPILWVIELFYQLLTTIDYLHNRHYAHCDLKPQNLFLRRPPHPQQAPLPVLIDFGTATTPQNGMAHLAGSLRYSPPEVLVALQRQDSYHQDHISPKKVDIWALGAILFEMIAGRPLANAKFRNGITTTIISGEFDQLSHVAGTHDQAILRKLDKILAQMLKTEAKKRPSTAMLIKAIEEKIPAIRAPRIPC